MGKKRGQSSLLTACGKLGSYLTPRTPKFLVSRALTRGRRNSDIAPATRAITGLLPHFCQLLDISSVCLPHRSAVAFSFGPAPRF
jgi:hypothetical protein